MKRSLFFSLLLAMALAATSVSANSIPAPPVAPSWWGTHAAFWGYANSATDPEDYDTNFSEFAVTITQDGNTITLSMENGYREEYDKHFTFYIQGAGASDPPVVNPSPVIGQNDPPHANSSVTLQNSQSFYSPALGTWWVEVEGIAHPQPDRVIFSFEVPGNPYNINWSAGEFCPEPATLSLFLLAGLVRVLRRR